MTKLDIAGLKIDAMTKKELLATIGKNIAAGKKIWVTTPYSEFLYAGLRDPEVLQMLNQADIAVPDGIGIFWAAKYLSIPLTAKSYWGKIAQAIWQAKYTLAAILLRPSWVKTLPSGVILRPQTGKTSVAEESQHQDNGILRPDALPQDGAGRWEKISGADLIWDLAKLAAENNLSVYLLGGFGNTPQLAKQKLISQYPNIPISTSSKNPDDPTVIADIKNAAPDLLFVAYGPIKQERWIAANLPNLPVKLAIGLGGSFDYLAGKVISPPRFMRQAGLEWLWRLFTQPHRAGRIYNAFFGLINKIILFKLSRELPLRKNAVSVILNSENKILICRRNPKPAKEDSVGENIDKFKNYWQLPQGGIEEDADVVSGAMREALEETGLGGLRQLGISKFTNSYNFPLTWYRIFKKSFRFRGQNQQVVYFKFSGAENAVKIDNDEFVDYAWCPINELGMRISRERQNLIAIVRQEVKEMSNRAII